MSLRKTATKEAPHARFVNEAAGWEWLVLKVNAPKKPVAAPWNTWLVAAKSPYTYGSYEMGDTYVQDVILYGELVEATDEFRAYIGEGV